jgi:uncharacterized protein YkwD
MFRRLMLLATVGAAAAGVFSMAFGASQSRPAMALTNCDTSTADLDAQELQVIELFNQARAQNGLAPYKVSPNLNRAAAWKSADPSATGSGGYAFSHTDSLGRMPSQRAQDCGYGGGAAENIAWGFGSAESVVNAWLNSPGHRAAILGNYKVVGVGRIGSARTANFGKDDDSGQAGDSGSGGGSGPGQATPTPFPPTSTPVLRIPTAAAPTATPTQFVPAPNDSYKYPTFVPIRRASIPMIAAE